MKARAIVFIALIALQAFICWLGGYNFDHRSWEVAFGSVCAIIFAVLGTALADTFL